MLRILNVKQFKCFADSRIEFGDLTVFAGANGVGKSSAIQALLLLGQAYLQKNREAGEKRPIPVNDKKDNFLELGSAKEILYSNARDSKIEFNPVGENGHRDQVIFSSGNNNLSLDWWIIWDKEQKEADLPFSRFIHYLNAERLGPRNTQDIAAQQEVNVGYQGEYTGQAIAEMGRRIKSVPESRQNKERKAGVSFDRQVEAWMDFIIPEVEINIETFENINQVRIGIRKKGSGTPFLHPNNIGFGISYVLPIVVAGLLIPEKSLWIIENPEAHLHPLGQSRVGQFLAKMASAGVQIVVETHSEHVINGIRIASLKGEIDHKNVIVNFFNQEKDKGVNIQKIELNEKGELRDWPKGFFDQEEHDLSEIFRLSRKKK